jgi:CheY-like chemotaxis protein
MARILVADDEDAVRTFVTRALTHDGHDVDAVADGAEALEALEAQAKSDEPPYNLLLTDIVMPRMDGIALALKVAKDFPTLRVLMMTGYPNEKQRAHNLETLIHDVVTKPFSLQEICAAVRDALQPEPA